MPKEETLLEAKPVIKTPTTEVVYFGKGNEKEDTSTMGEPLPPEDLPRVAEAKENLEKEEEVNKKKEGTAVGKDQDDDGGDEYQQDASWDPAQDEEEIIQIEEEDIPFIQQKTGVTNLKQNSMMVLIRPQKVTRDTMVRSLKTKFRCPQIGPQIVALSDSSSSL